MVQALLDAVAAANDVATEAAVAQLTTANEAALLPRLNTTDLELCWWVIRALAACGTEQSIIPLLAHLANDDATLRSAAAMAIGTLAQRFPNSLVLQPHLTKLIALFADPDGLVRQVAADALAQCGNLALPVLVEVLRFSSDQSARSRAAYVLGKLGTVDAAPALYHCLNDQNYLVHTYAHEALDKLGLLENVLMVP